MSFLTIWRTNGASDGNRRAPSDSMTQLAAPPGSWIHRRRERRRLEFRENPQTLPG